MSVFVGQDRSSNTAPPNLSDAGPTDVDRKRIILWLYEEDYVVILADRKKYVLLWTAYMVTYRHTKERLLKEYEEYYKRLTPPQ